VNVKRLDDGSCIRLRPAYPNHVPQRPAGRCSLGEWIIRLLADDGPMTLLRTAPIVRRRRTIRCKAPRPGGLGGTDAGSACLTSSTSSPARAWRSGSAASSTRSTSSTSCPTCSPWVPGHVRSDNGPEFIAKVVRDWISAVGAKTAYIEPGSPLQGRCRGPDPCGTGSTALLSMGEWLLRKLQRQAPGRAAQRRDLHHAETRPGS
jgi:hypothetical protein